MENTLSFLALFAIAVFVAVVFFAWISFCFKRSGGSPWGLVCAVPLPILMTGLIFSLWADLT